MEFLPYFSEFFPWIVSKLVDYIGTVCDIGILGTNWPDEPQKEAKTMYTAGCHSRLYFISFDNPNFQKTWAAECQWINSRRGYFTTNIIRQFQHNKLRKRFRQLGYQSNQSSLKPILYCINRFLSEPLYCTASSSCKICKKIPLWAQ